MGKVITPESIAGDTEDGEQLALMCWCALNFKVYPDLRWLHHSPNGGYRNKREAGKFKAMGVKAGFPDLILLIRRGTFSGLGIELKIPGLRDAKDGGAKPNQLLWAEHLRQNGFGYKLCHGWIDARDTLISYLEWKG